MDNLILSLNWFFSLIAYVFAGLLLLPKAMNYFLLWRKDPVKVIHFGISATLFITSFFLFSALYLQFLKPFIR